MYREIPLWYSLMEANTIRPNFAMRDVVFPENEVSSMTTAGPRLLVTRHYPNFCIRTPAKVLPIS